MREGSHDDDSEKEKMRRDEMPEAHTLDSIELPGLESSREAR